MQHTQPPTIGQFVTQYMDTLHKYVKSTEPFKNQQLIKELQHIDIAVINFQHLYNVPDAHQHFSQQVQAKTAQLFPSLKSYATR